MAYVWQFCDCGHPDDDHRTTGPCRTRDAYGYPCECRQFDDGRPTAQPTADGGIMSDTTHTCPRRMSDIGPWRHEPGLDTWATGHGLVGVQGEQLSCSFCGSLHPDVFMQWLRDGGQIGTTGKSYKAYIDCPYPNERYGETTEGQVAVEGGGAYRSVSVYGRTSKFYFQHLSGTQQQEFVELYNASTVTFSGGFGFEALPFFMRSAA